MNARWSRVPLAVSVCEPRYLGRALSNAKIFIHRDLPALPRKFYVNGEVRRAGDYSYERELTLHKAISMAGGFTDKAATSRAKVIRKIEGKKQEISLDFGRDHPSRGYYCGSSQLLLAVP